METYLVLKGQEKQTLFLHKFFAESTKEKKKDRKPNDSHQGICEAQKIIPWTGSVSQVKIQNINPMVKNLLIETLFLLLSTIAVFNILFYFFEERQLSSNRVELENKASGKMINSINPHRCQCKYLFLSERSPWCGYC